MAGLFLSSCAVTRSMSRANRKTTSASVTMPDSDFEPLLDSEQAAALLKIHPKTLQQMARRGEVAAVQIGRLWRFRASALNRWLQKIAR